MTVGKEKLKTTKYKIYLIFWIAYWCVTAWYYFRHSAAVLPSTEDTHKILMIFLYITVIIFMGASICFCFFRWGTGYKQRTPEGKEYKPLMKWYHILFLVAIDLYCFIEMEMINNSEKIGEMELKYILANLAGGLIMGLLLLLWFNSLRRACLTLLIFTTTMALIFYFVYLTRGEPLQLIDIFSFKTAWGIKGSYEFVFTRSITVFLCTSLCLIAIILHCPDRMPAKRKAARIGIRIGAFGAMVAGYFFLLYAPWNTKLLSITTDLWAPHKTYVKVGTNVGFFCVTKFMRNDPPEGYSLNSVREITEQSAAEYEQWDNKPVPDDVTPVNIIAIMNESWADYKHAADFETNTDYMPYYNSLDENVIKGYNLVNIWGGGTAKSEYEFLTGNSTKQYHSYVPYVNFYTHNQYSLVSTLKDAGYSAIAIHPNKGTNWNRINAYDYLGFDRFFTIDDFAENSEKIRGMVSDKENYRKIISLIEEKENPNDPLFIFDVTLQNHGGYSTNNYTNDVFVNGFSNDTVNRYLSLVKNTDEATEYLLEYLKELDEPTIVVMFGDHYPDLPVEFEEFITGAKKEDLSLEDRVRYYETPFFIWTNYDTETETDVITSCNFLGTMMLEKTGLPMPAFNHYIQMLREKIAGYNQHGYYTPDKVFHTWESAPEEVNSLINVYEILQYNALMANANRADWFFLP